jgi:hypothetical protein
MLALILFLDTFCLEAVWDLDTKELLVTNSWISRQICSYDSWGLSPTIFYYVCLYNWIENKPESCVYHIHILDPLNGGSPRNNDIDLVHYSDESVTFNEDAVDMTD